MVLREIAQTEPTIMKMVGGAASLSEVFALMDQHDERHVSRSRDGIVTPTNTLAVLAPYLTVIGLVAIAATVYAAKRP